jgi:hypothetical protein
MQAHFRHVSSNDIRNSSIQWVLTPAIALWRVRNPSGLQLQSGSSLGSMEVHSLTLSHTPRSMKCDFRASLLARTFASPYLGREPKAKVVTCNLWNKERVCEGIISKNIKAWWIGEVFGVKFRLGLWVLSCLFKLGLWNKKYSTCIFFPGDGVGGHYDKHSTYNLPMLAICPFLVQNWKMVSSSTNQLCIVFGGDYQGRWAWPKKTFLAPSSSCLYLALLKSYHPLHLHRKIQVPRKWGQLETNYKGWYQWLGLHQIPCSSQYIYILV